jgi:hypothetical protein
MYERNPRVEVETSPKPYYGYLHGEIFLAYHHGHKVTDDKLPGIFSSDPAFRSDWGKARYAFIHTGHLHNHNVYEGAGVIVERHATLAARDAYSARGGWQSWRCAKAITYHKTRGEVSRATVTPELEGE